MSREIIRVLLVDPEGLLAERVAAAIAEVDDGPALRLETVATPEEVPDRIAENGSQVVLLPLPRRDHAGVLPALELRASVPGTPVVVLCRPEYEPIAIKAVQLGVADYLLKLYITGETARTRRAIANLRKLCEEELADSYELEIIDILEHPKLAEDERILATPTLIKQLPPPLRRVIGDLSDRDQVLLGLDLRSTGETASWVLPPPPSTRSARSPPASRDSRPSRTAACPRAARRCSPAAPAAARRSSQSSSWPPAS